VAADIAACTSKGCNIIIATPGRLLDVLQRNTASATTAADASSGVVVKTLEVLVLDEADVLLDLGFEKAITAILAAIPKQRRTGLFSATQTNEVRALMRAGMRNPVTIKVAVQATQRKAAAIASGSEPASRAAASATAEASEAATSVSTRIDSTPQSLRNYYVACSDPLDKLGRLCALLAARAAAKDKVIVFVLTCAGVDFYARALEQPSVRAAAGLPPGHAAFPVLPLHGQQDAKKRAAMYAAFAAARGGAALLCTDVAARGIDIPDVDWILQVGRPRPGLSSESVIPECDVVCSTTRPRTLPSSSTAWVVPPAPARRAVPPCSCCLRRPVVATWTCWPCGACPSANSRRTSAAEMGTGEVLLDLKWQCHPPLQPVWRWGEPYRRG
jgi:ATP-dependent RNA helicase DDX55/SPB4